MRLANTDEILRGCFIAPGGSSSSDVSNKGARRINEVIRRPKPKPKKSYR